MKSHDATDITVGMEGLKSATFVSYKILKTNSNIAH
jgi:hypothetical protein